MGCYFKLVEQFVKFCIRQNGFKYISVYDIGLIHHCTPLVLIIQNNTDISTADGTEVSSSGTTLHTNNLRRNFSLAVALLVEFVWNLAASLETLFVT